MAHKGDFPECQRCTSFQCKTCGLDQGPLKIEGDVTQGNSMINFNLLLLVYVGIAYISRGLTIGFVNGIILIGFPILSIILFWIHRVLREENSNNPEAEKFFLMALGLDMICGVFLLWPVIKIFME